MFYDVTERKQNGFIAIIIPWSQAQDGAIFKSIEHTRNPPSDLI